MESHLVEVQYTCAGFGVPYQADSTYRLEALQHRYELSLSRCNKLTYKIGVASVGLAPSCSFAHSPHLTSNYLRQAPSYHLTCVVLETPAAVPPALILPASFTKAPASVHSTNALHIHSAECSWRPAMTTPGRKHSWEIRGDLLLAVS